MHILKDYFYSLRWREVTAIRINDIMITANTTHQTHPTQTRVPPTSTKPANTAQYPDAVRITITINPIQAMSIFPRLAILRSPSIRFKTLFGYCSRFLSVNDA